jgi:hypothetical protein
MKIMPRIIASCVVVFLILFIGGFMKDYYTVDIVAPLAPQQVKDDGSAFAVVRASVRIVSVINWLSFFIVLISLIAIWKGPVQEGIKKMNL